jgi:hypothetical protein
MINSDEIQYLSWLYHSLEHVYINYLLKITTLKTFASNYAKSGTNCFLDSLTEKGARGKVDT